MAEKPKNSRKFRWVQEVSPDGSIVNKPSYEVYTFKPPPSEIIEARVESSLLSGGSSVSSSYATSASFASTASFLLGSVESASFATTSSYA
jgi:hypothetical protein